MSTTSVDLQESGRKHPHHTTRHLLVDRRFAAVLAEDFGIQRNAVLRALEDEPQRQAIAICSWAERTTDPQGALLAWARKHRRGTYGEAREAQERPSGERSGAGRYSATARERSFAPESLRGIQADPDRLAALAEKMGV